MGSTIAGFKWPEGQIRKFLATVTVVVLVAVAVGATAQAVGAADPTAPGAPTQLSAVWSSGEVTLSWQAPASDGGSSVNGYEYRYWVVNEEATDDWTSLNADALSATVDELTDDVAYRFELRAVNPVDSGASDTIDAMPLSLREGDIRIALGANDHEGMVQVYVGDRWGKVCDDYFGHQAVTIACRQLGYADGMGDNDGSGYWALYEPLIDSNIPYVMDDVLCSGCEDRLIDCLHSAEANCYHSEVILVSCDTTSLGAARNVLFIPGTEQGRLVWNTPRSDGGTPIARYEYRYRQLHGQYGDWIDAGRNLTATVSAPADGSAQRFELRAVNAEGAGPLTGVGATMIKGLTLIDAERDLPLNGVYDRDTVHLPEFDTDEFSFRVDVPNNANVHSMKLTLTDPRSVITNRDLSRPGTGRKVWSLFGADPHRRYPQSRIDNLDYVIPDNYDGQKLPPGRYTLAATAYASDDWTGDALDSTTVSFTVTVQVPSAPRDPKADWSADELTLSWSPPADDGKGTISAYEYRSQLGGPNSGEWTGLELATSVTLAATADGAGINFEVRARNEAGEGPAASFSSPVAPAKPRKVDVSVSVGQLHLNWEAPQLNGGASISGYQYRYGTSVSALGAWSAAQTTLTATIDSIEEEAAYVAEVRALNGVGHGLAALGSTPVIIGVTLIDADNASELQSISDGGYVILSIYDKNGYFYDDWFGFRIDPHPRASIGSMRIVLKGPKNQTRVEIGEPYSLYGDKGPGEIYGTVLPTGQYHLSATAYPGTEPTGDRLQTLEIKFNVVSRLAAEPRNLSAHREDGTLTLSWSAPANEAVETILRYEYRSTMSGEPFGDEWISVGARRDASFENLDATASYDFEVRAVGASGAGPASSLTVPALPRPPSNVMLDVDNGAATLTWDPPLSNGGSAITGYQYRFGAIDADLGGWSEPQTSRTVTIPVSDEDQAYLAQVRALNSTGHGPVGTAGTSIMQSVQLVDTGRNSDLVRLTNNMVIVRSDYDTDWFGIRMDPFPGAPVGSARFELSGAKNLIQNENWEPFSLYGDRGHGELNGERLPVGEYRLTVTVFSGYDRTGDILQSIELGFTVVESLPETPEGIEANWSNGTLSLSWLPAANADDALITNYEYRATPSDQSFVDEWTDVGTQLGVDLPGVEDGAATNYEVRARNAAGEGSAASFSSPQPPGAPQQLVVDPGDAMLDLSWTAPERNGGASVSRYEYRIGAVGEEPGSWTSAGSGLNTKIAGLSNGTTYTVELRAENSAGGGAATQVLAKVSMTNLITGFTLLDHSDQANNTLELTDGITVALSDFSGTGLAIRANISNESMVDRVQFELSGRQSYGKKEWESPYSLYGDNGPDDLNGGAFEVGSYQLTATVYAKTSAGGGVLATRTISFTVTQHQSGQQQTSVPNSAAKRVVPAIIGVAQVGQTLMVDTSGIADEDGLTTVVFTYQWVRSDETEVTNIQGATGATYTPVKADVGKTLKVRVSFTDDADNVQTLTSAATAEVAATLPTEPLNLTVATGSQIQELDASWQIPASDGGSDITGYRVQWKETTGSWDTLKDVSEETVTGTTYTITGLTGGVEYAVRVMATNDVGDGPASFEATGRPAGGISQQNTEPENADPTGLPSISGTVRVGESLTADVTGIVDQDGLTNPAFTYQWVRSDGGVDTNIQDATGSTYTLTEDDEGKTIKVTVSFTDAAGNPETLTSDPTGEVAAKPNTQATGLPTISGTVQVGQTLTASTAGIVDADGLDNVTFSYQWLAEDANIQGATRSSYTLTSAEQGKAIKVTVSFTDAAGNPETLTSDPTGEVAAKPNIQATGLPTISGTAQVGETLTADTAGIADQDGLTNPAFTYQWVRSDGGVDTNIQDATGSSYILTGDDEGKTIKVLVSFADEAGNMESLPSAPTDVVAAAPAQNIQATGQPTISGTVQVGETLTASTAGIVDADGLTQAEFSYQWLADDANIQGATSSSYTLTSAEQGKAITVRVSFTDAEGNPETLTSDPTGEVAAKPNSQATGAPTISGTAQVGQTLTADTSEIDDEDGLKQVVFSYQWLADDANIQGATRSSYPLTSAEQGKAITVTVSFTDAEGNPETLTSDPTGEVAAKPNTQATGQPTISGTVRVGETLTADVTGVADEDGLKQVVFSYQWIRNDGNADEDIAGATGSSYTLTDNDKDKTITVTVSFTDGSGNPETLDSEATGEVEAKPNTSATGVPTIDGTAQVGQTLTADTSGIDDEDGLNQVVFSYQWIRNDGSADEDIAGATGSSYTLTEDDEGTVIKVTVSFTDEAGNPETRTSDATGEVESQAGPLSGFTLVDAADADQAVLWKHQTDGSKPEEGDRWKEWTDGGTLALGDPDNGRYGIRADTESGEGIHRVALELTLESTGEKQVERTDDAAPYSLYGDEGEDALHGESLPVGSYTLKATAYTEDGETLGSLEVSFTVALAKPGKPQDLEGEATAQEIKLTWKVPTGSVVVEYVVYRGVLRNGSMNGQALSKHATIDAAGKAMTYTDGNAEEGAEYRYRVAAVNTAGEGKKSNRLDITAE